VARGHRIKQPLTDCAAPPGFATRAYQPDRSVSTTYPLGATSPAVDESTTNRRIGCPIDHRHGRPPRSLFQRAGASFRPKSTVPVALRRRRDTRRRQPFPLGNDWLLFIDM